MSRHLSTRNISSKSIEIHNFFRYPAEMQKPGVPVNPVRRATFYPNHALSVLCAQLTRDLLALAKFLLNMVAMPVHNTLISV